MFVFMDVKDSMLRIFPAILREARNKSLDPLLVAAIAWQESGCNPWAFRFESGFQARYILPMSIDKIHAQSPLMKKRGTPSERSERTALATSFGAMQIIGQTARELGFRGQFLTELCGEEGIVYGVCHFANCKDRYKGNIEEAISAYNAGTATPRNHADYVVPVLKRYKILQQESEVQRWLKEMQ